MRRNLAVCALVAIGVLAGCSTGGDASDGADAPRTTSTTLAPAATTTTAIVVGRWSYVTALRGRFSDELPIETDAELADGDAASCLADAVVDALEEDRLESAGIEATELADGGFLPALDLDDAERRALEAAVGAAYLECGAMAAIFRESFEGEGAAHSEEGIECAAAAIAPALGPGALRSLDDPAVTVYDEGWDLAPSALGACPAFAADLLAVALEEDGRTLTDPERACVLDALTQAAHEHEYLDQADLVAYAEPCLGG